MMRFGGVTPTNPWDRHPACHVNRGIGILPVAFLAYKFNQ